MLFVPRATKERKERFIHAMQMAEDILRINPSGISTLVRLLAASLQAKSLNSVVLNGLHKSKSGYDFGNLFFDDLLRVSKQGHSAYELSFYSERKILLKLGRDPILAAPWHRGRLVDAIANIGIRSVPLLAELTLPN
jgi:hypothetical protein